MVRYGMKTNKQQNTSLKTGTTVMHKPSWILETYPATAKYTEILTDDEATIIAVSYQNSKHQHKLDIIRKSLWEGGLYTIKKKV